MLTHHTVEHAKAYLDAHLGQRVPETVGVIPTDGPFITISRESGSGGTSLACLLAARLNQARHDGPSWTVFDQDIVGKVLEDQHLSPQLARYLPEGKVSEVDALMREIVGLHPNLWTLVQKTNALIQKIAKCGHAILVGRGARFATTSISRGLHVRLVSPPDHRAKVMAEKLKLPLTEATAQNRRVDDARAAYVRSVFDADVADCTAYDLVLNTGRLPLARIVDIAAGLVQVGTPRVAGPTVIH